MNEVKETTQKIDMLEQLIVREKSVHVLKGMLEGIELNESLTGPQKRYYRTLISDRRDEVMYR